MQASQLAQLHIAIVIARGLAAELCDEDSAATRDGKVTRATGTGLPRPAPEPRFTFLCARTKLGAALSRSENMKGTKHEVVDG